MKKTKRIKNVLGVTMGVCSGAAVFSDGRIVASISEERFTKRKNYDGYPKNAIDKVLSLAKISPEDIDYIALASKNVDPVHIVTHQECDRTIDDWIREMREYWHPIFYGGKKRSYIDVFSDKLDLEQYPGGYGSISLNSGNRVKMFEEFRKDTIARHLGASKQKIKVCEHHLSHASYALFGIPKKADDMLVFTADGFGDYSNASLRRYNGKKLDLKYETDICNLGRLYRYITLLLGMKPGEHEYKVMGLAPYAHPRFYKDILEMFKNTLYVDGIEFKYKTRPTDHYFWFRDKLEGRRFDAIAGGIQSYAEWLLTEWIGGAVRKYGVGSVAFSGGVSLNIKANQQILRLPEVSSLCVPGSGGDESLAMGAIFSLLMDKGTAPDEIEPLEHLYLGDRVSRKEIDDYIRKERLERTYSVSRGVTPRTVAQLLANGEIIGRFAGRMEFGQRSLGNRSILANPSRPDAVKVINEIIKQRDFWMPFAPTILHEDCDRYLQNPKGIYSPFMTIGFDTKPAAHKDLIAALHPADLTARPQMLRKRDNPDYHALISEFKSLTGIGGVLNTSFNLHGLPIVQSISDAMHVMENSKMKYLLLEDVLLRKKGA